jgi:hypothetical protein
MGGATSKNARRVDHINDRPDTSKKSQRLSIISNSNHLLSDTTLITGSKDTFGLSTSSQQHPTSSIGETNPEIKRNATGLSDLVDGNSEDPTSKISNGVESADEDNAPSEISANPAFSSRRNRRYEKPSDLNDLRNEQSNFDTFIRSDGRRFMVLRDQKSGNWNIVDFQEQVNRTLFIS